MSDNHFFQPPQGEKDLHKYHTPIEKRFHASITSFKRFIHDQITASVLLLIATIFAMSWVSIESVSDVYFKMQHMVLDMDIGQLHTHTTLKLFVNDFLMTFFFFLLGLEIKKEFLAGELKDMLMRNTVLFAAFGGVITPASIYLFISPDQYDLQGWGIPVATDTAFAVGLLALLRKRIPSSIFTFVAALAVIDDLAAIVILALFYTSSLVPSYFVISLALLGVLIFLNLLGVRHFLPYLLLGGAVWWFVEHSGLHGTLAGVLVALTIPARPKAGPKRFFDKIQKLTSRFKNRESEMMSTILEDELKQDILEEVEVLAQQTSVPLMRIQHKVEPYVILLILPLFALLNAGILVNSETIVRALAHPISIAIFFALLFGKPIGISLATWVICRFKVGRLPTDARMGHIVGVSALAGIGFTMSIFIAELAFDNVQDIDIAKMGIFAASVMAGMIGFACLYWVSRQDAGKVQVF